MSAAPDRYAVLGHPVQHSQSPFIHAEFARQTGQPLVYIRVACAPDAFAATLREFAASVQRGFGQARGCNVTVPFKFDVPSLAQRLTARARLAGAANVLCFDAEGWSADNTDGVGLVRDLEGNANFRIAGKQVLLIGAGGAGAGVLGPLLQAGPASLVLANRTLERAQALVERHRPLAEVHGVALRASGLEAVGSGFDLVLNATASSLQGAAAPVADRVLHDGTLAVDLMYGAASQPFLQWARARGASARDGLGMLVEQAAEAFLGWRGLRPDTAPVLAALRARLATAA